MVWGFLGTANIFSDKAEIYTDRKIRWVIHNRFNWVYWRTELALVPLSKCDMAFVIRRLLLARRVRMDGSSCSHWRRWNSSNCCVNRQHLFCSKSQSFYYRCSTDVQLVVTCIPNWLFSKIPLETCQRRSLLAPVFYTCLQGFFLEVHWLVLAPF